MRRHVSLHRRPRRSRRWPRRALMPRISTTKPRLPPTDLPPGSSEPWVARPSACWSSTPGCSFARQKSPRPPSQPRSSLHPRPRPWPRLHRPPSPRRSIPSPSQPRRSLSQSRPPPWLPQSIPTPCVPPPRVPPRRVPPRRVPPRQRVPRPRRAQLRAPRPRHVLPRALAQAPTDVRRSSPTPAFSPHVTANLPAFPPSRRQRQGERRCRFPERRLHRRPFPREQSFRGLSQNRKAPDGATSRCRSIQDKGSAYSNV